MILTELIIILVLLVLNGVFSMSEAAVIASRRARLQQQAERGEAGAKAALRLAEDPTRFLSTVQIGITLIGILTGAFGGATLSEEIAARLGETPLAPYAEALSFGAVVLLTTYLSLIIGELVPKRLALRNPERIASTVAPPMKVLSRLTSPVVTLLTASTNGVLWALRVRESEEPPVTEEEITAMIAQGIEAGVFEEAEHEMVENVFRFGDRRVSQVMTPRTEITWLDVEDTPEEIRQTIVESDVSRFPVCEGDLDHVLGVVAASELLRRTLTGQPLDVRTAMTEPLFVPESVLAARLLERMKREGQDMALIVGEHGGIQGLVTIQDLLEEIVGTLDDEELEIVQRADGSWLVSGMLAIDDLKETLEIDIELPGEGDSYETLGGFVMFQLGRIPSTADVFHWEGWRFEVMDMDGNRVDKILIDVINRVDSEQSTGKRA